MLGRLQHELCRGYGVDNARKVLQGALVSVRGLCESFESVIRAGLIRLDRV
jgi:hypothetical protein